MAVEPRALTHGSLFAGIEGFGLAAKLSGIKTVWSSDIEPNARKVIAKHLPNSEIHGDIRKIGKHNLRPVDILTGGSPCQDFSIAGTRSGLTGERSGLWYEFARVIDELEPLWVVLENVPGLLSSAKGWDFAIIVQWLAKRGYGVCWRIFDSQYFGVPQRRRRVFIVGHLGTGRAAQVLLESPSLCRNTSARQEARKEVAGTLGSGTSSSNGRLDDTFVVSPLTTRVGRSEDRGDGLDNLIVMAHGQGGAEIATDKSPCLSCNHEAPIAFNFKSSGQNGFGAGEVAPTLQSMQGVNGNHSGGGNVAIFMAGQGSKAGGIGYSEDVSPTLKGMNSRSNQVPTIWQDRTQSDEVRVYEGISPSLSSRMGTGGNQVPMVGVRRLMPIECLRLQGFPDDWLDGLGLSDSAKYRLIGNAVAVPVVQWILGRISNIGLDCGQT